MDPNEPFIRRPQASALLIIDMQNDFLLPGAPVAAPGGLELVPAMSRLARRARRAGAPVMFTASTGSRYVKETRTTAASIARG